MSNRQTIITECDYPKCGCMRCGRCGNAIKDDMINSEVETVGWAILQALHEGVEDGPQSWSDLADDQERRVKKAAVAAIEAVTDLSQYTAQGFSMPVPPEMQSAIRVWLECPADKRPSPAALGQRITEIAATVSHF